MASLKAPSTVSSNAIAHFLKDPHLAGLLSSPKYDIMEPFQYTPIAKDAPRTTYDGLFETTLSTPETLPHYLGLHLRTFPPIPTQSFAPNEPLGPPHYFSLVAFGTPGVSGHAGLAHGGVLAAILDQVLGACVEMQQTPPFNIGTFTATMEIQYKKPVVVPGDYLWRAWTTHKERRKFWTKGEMVSPDGKHVYVTGSALMIEAKREGKL